MASNAPGDCCRKGYVYGGTPAGEFTTFAGTPIYVAEPAAGKSATKAILYLTDIFGLPITNHKLIADQFAGRGFLTLVPDLFNDDPAPYPNPADWDLLNWLKSHDIEHTEPVINKAFDLIKASYPSVTEIHAVGYCFGAKYVVRLLGEGRINSGFVAHPSLITEDELKAIKGPLSIAAAETDHIFPAEKRHLSEQILIDIKATYFLSLYSGVTHGFAVRGDLEDAEVIWAQEQAFEQALTWFARFAKK
ncbi:dienelactone hydrolase [Lipomyces japonicus]|uniref:dienelactone hydrolase n=1 Tax=Lipomyces japonicus TaxID=56871 RepID=UPI0034CD7F14